ncbi:hypothetical protein GCM10007973_02870 [Polymorphobacter multimanifer]|uniref:DUF1476 domain-containing protein n=1 Tax=Polymorphobacter multimanifer TaxID=1070431 RepID=A0A841L599_9SPHN|nr:DUF1476 domain-containing protein [Polymorphobacter multimanifer]MBB6226651.1 hypothetical protein [Polymorphobacter multimanifer]GGI69208.1 hypothetical protein GCM10007973_02870 [Polymorphobacter multimanifer]
MTSFDDRKDAYENKFAHDAETLFRVLARRDRLVGEWAAGFLGLDATETEAYAKSVVIADLEEAGDEDVVRKLVADLAPAGVDETTIRAKLLETAEVARQQITNG